MPQLLRKFPKKARPLSGRGALPSLASLANMEPAKLVDTLGRFGLAPDMVGIEKAANRAFDRLESILAEGSVPDEATWQQIQAGVEKEVLGTIKKQAKAAVRNYKTARAEESGAEVFMWITSGQDNVCPSCDARHGDLDTMAGWRRRGLPGSAALLCGANCNCHLQPTF